MKTLIFMTMNGMGDLAIFWPIWREIARQTPDGKVSFLIPPSAGNAQDILKQQDWVAGVELLHPSLKARGGSFQNLKKYFSIINYTRKNKFSSVWMFRDGFKYFLLFYLGGAKNIYGRNNHFFSFLFKNKPKIISNLPLEPYQRYLGFSEFLGEHSYSQENMIIPINGQHKNFKKPYITMGLGGANFADLKRWPISYWSKLIQLIADNDPELDFHLVGGTREINDMEEIKNTLPSFKERIILQSNLKMEKLLPLLKNSTYTIAHDTGVLYMSCRAGTKSYALYGRHSFKAYQNPKNLTYVLKFNPTLIPIFINPTLPFDLHKTDMDKITPEQVIKTICSNSIQR